MPLLPAEPDPIRLWVRTEQKGPESFSAGPWHVEHTLSTTWCGRSAGRAKRRHYRGRYPGGPACPECLDAILGTEVLGGHPRPVTSRGVRTT
jgi:hypothetical protein